jgi:hypothetical protein
MSSINGWEVGRSNFGVTLRRDDNLYLLIAPTVWGSDIWKASEIDNYIKHNMRPITDEDRPAMVEEVIRLAAS